MIANFHSMLAAKSDPAHVDSNKSLARVQWPMLASPKLDGVRCHVIERIAVSRNLLPFRNATLQRMIGRLKLEGLDGELMVGDPLHPEAFRRCGVTNSFDGDLSELMFYVFDDFTNPHKPFVDRLARVSARIAKARIPYVQAVPHTVVRNVKELAKYEAQCLKQGYEGVMLRAPHGPYKYGRATFNEGYLIKVKQFEDSEAIILGCEELMHNANDKTLVKNGKAIRNHKLEGLVGMNRLGAYEVQDVKTGITFSVGSGFTDAERMDLWDGANLNIGKVIKYRYFPTGSKDKPRFPTFLGFRDPADL
jgi:DNA ligase 1